MAFVEWVAEVSSNHHQDLARCLRFIDVAAEIGCDAVKFQLFTVATMFAPEILTRSAAHRARTAWELPSAFLPAIAARCHERAIKFLCTPFSLQAVEELFPFVDALKIASYELPWDDLLRACAKTGKPCILSTGMATMREVRHAVEVLYSVSRLTHLTVLHCSSAYPTPVNDCNLSAIQTLRRELRWFADPFPVGWSDHSASPAVLLRAVHRWQVSMVEFHLDLDGTGEEGRVGHCWLPEQIAPVIAMIRQGEQADGDGIKAPQPSELADRAWRREPNDGLRPTLAMREAWRMQL